MMTDDTAPNWPADGFCNEVETSKPDPIRYLLLDAVTQTVTEHVGSLSLHDLYAVLGCESVDMFSLHGGDWLWFDENPLEVGTSLDMFAIEGSPIPAQRAVITGPEDDSGILTDRRHCRDALLQRIQWLPKSEILREITTVHTDPTGASAFGVQRIFDPPA